MRLNPDTLPPSIEVTNQWETQKVVLNVIPEIVYSPETCALEHASINGPPFPTTTKSKTQYFSNRGRSNSPDIKKGGIVGTIDFGPASPRRRPKRIKAQKRPKHPYTNMDPGLKSSLWTSTPSSNQLLSLRRWSASDFSADSLQFENISSQKPRM